MKTFTLTRQDGATANVSADRFETDGAGTRLFDEAGHLIATFAYGQIVSVMDAQAVSFGPAPSNDNNEH